ncbi:hypothetical protein HNR39_002639 [Glaciimonas immobilis]|uniref:Uncharacterized protein n=1 Tax=Glaciimonas immobilis TaxID=728004 RepID=A0A840RQU2_9BURK|nr:hypothetical protein [Glaciimonas immobilis]
MNLCSFCEANAGRINANRECCQLRDLAQSPRHTQAAYGASLTESARVALRPKLVEEIKRLKLLKLNQGDEK